MEAGYKNLGYFFLILIFFVFLGFYKTYFGLFPHFNEATTPVVHFHAFVLFIWVCVVITQPLLIRYQKFNTHRRIGKFTYFLVPLMVFSFVLMWQRGLSKNGAEDSLSSIVKYILKQNFHSLFDVLLLISLYSLAVFNKKRTAYHMRFMIATTLILIDPTLSRLLYNWFHFTDFNADLVTCIFTDLILVGLIIYDKKYNRTYKPYLIALSLFLVYHVSFLIRHFYI